MTAILDVRALCVDFQTRSGRLRAVDALSFEIFAGETVALVGESGCGKSTAALALLGLTSSSQGIITADGVLFEGRNLFDLTARQLRQVRGEKIAMIFQDPSAYLNPVHSVGRQIGEVLEVHQGLGLEARRARVVELLALVGVPAPQERIDQYPQNLSGGMRQRVMIAMALACNPTLLIADEPTTALDVTIQAQVLRLIDELKNRLGMSVLLITHDLGVVSETADRVVVMYAGRKVEEGTTIEVLSNPRHPYTQGLLRAASWSRNTGGIFYEIPGTVPPLDAPRPGCAFAQRCPVVMDRCHATRPTSQLIGVRRSVSCLLEDAL